MLVCLSPLRGSSGFCFYYCRWGSHRFVGWGLHRFVGRGSHRLPIIRRHSVTLPAGGGVPDAAVGRRPTVTVVSPFGRGPSAN